MFKSLKGEFNATAVFVDTDINECLRRNNLRDKLEIEEKKAKFIMGEMDKNKAAFLSAKEILKDKIAHYDDIIERELKFARLRKYEDDVNFNNARVYYDYNNQ